MMETLKKVMSIFIGLGVMSALSTESSWSAENELTTLTCIFDGYGTSSPSSNPMKVKLEQTVKFNEDGVSSIKHNFITDFEFNEGYTVRDGQKYQWLEFDSEVTDDAIRFSSSSNGNPKKSESSNIKYFFYTSNILISRKTGIGTREVSLSFDIESIVDRRNVTSYIYQYQVSGDCKVLGNKF